MPLCTLHLVRLTKEAAGPAPSSSALRSKKKESFLRRLLSDVDLGPRLLIASLVRRPVILAERIDSVYLNATPWDLLLVFGPDARAPAAHDSSSIEAKPTPLRVVEDARTRAFVEVEYVLDVGIPTRILTGYRERTKSLVEAAAAAKRPSSDSLVQGAEKVHEGVLPRTSQRLEMSDELLNLIDELEGLKLSQDDGLLVDGRGPVHQLNLLKFKPTKEDRERYLEYGRGFAKAAEAHGGDAKLLGIVVQEKSAEKGGADASQKLRWDEVSLVHYHSLRDFAAMAASEAYQSINRNKRLPSLLDTTIICTQEVDLDRLRSRMSKL